jgi:hypothetical protein
MPTELAKVDFLKRYIDIVAGQEASHWEHLRLFVESFARHKQSHPQAERIDQNLCEVFRLSVRVSEIMAAISDEASLDLDRLLGRPDTPFPLRPLPNDPHDRVGHEEGTTKIRDTCFPHRFTNFLEKGPEIQDQMSKLLSQDVGKSAAGNFHHRSDEEETDKQNGDHPSSGRPHSLRGAFFGGKEQSLENKFSRAYHLFFMDRPPLSQKEEADPVPEQEEEEAPESRDIATRLGLLKRNTRMHHSHKLSKRERGTYNICSMGLKNEAISISRQSGIKAAAELLKIPEKNIKRWMKQGPERKKGAGRKTMDPAMERGLLDWIADTFRQTKVFPDFKEVKAQAKFFSNNGSFKASKGWCDKFMRRNLVFFSKLREDVTRDIGNKPVFSNLF